MSELLPIRESDGATDRSAFAFAAGAAALAVLAAVLAGWVPLRFSIVTVFLFAGPHNWLEFRYFMSRMPARWGPLATFFTLGIAGTLLLSAGFASIPFLADRLGWEFEDWTTASSVWSTVLILWIAALMQLRSHQLPRRDLTWAFPVAFALVAGVWLRPFWWDIALVYLHPLMALWFLDRELRRSRPQWLSAYRGVLLMVPVLLAALWFRLADAPNLPGPDALSMRITEHAGDWLVTGVSTHLLVAWHTFLEMLHYGVWVIAIPLVGLRSAPWRIEATPLGRRSPAWRIGCRTVFALGGLVVLVLWAAFWADYATTRDVYFTVALAHVFVEVPFLIRSI